MSEEAQKTAVRNASEGGITAEHPPLQVVPLLVGSATANEKNTIKLPVIPIACWRLEDFRFEFDSSFVRPEAKTELELLAALRKDHEGAPLTIFGHADPVGNDDYNKDLSGRRAEAIYGLLTREVDLWEKLFGAPRGGDDWGTKSIQIMLDALRHPPGTIDGKLGPDTRQAVKQFQSAIGLPPDGEPGPQTRKKLFRAYMDALCGDLKLDKKADFLGRGADADGKGDYQGCSEFNPVLMFSKEENQSFAKDPDKTERNAENAPNRRVVIYLFRPGLTVDPQVWPCPRAKEGVAGCKKRFWSDADKRRAFQEERREYSKTHDTFACRFYERIATRSPCEEFLKFKGSHISVLLRSNSGAVPLAELPYQIHLDDGRVLEGKTGKDGLIEHADVPPGDYKLEIKGKAFETLVPTLPAHLSRRTLRIEDFFLFADDNPGELPAVDPDKSLSVNELGPNEGGHEVMNG